MNSTSKVAHSVYLAIDAGCQPGAKLGLSSGIPSHDPSPCGLGFSELCCERECLQSELPGFLRFNREIPEHHFCCILLIKEVIKAGSYSREGELGSIC